MSETAANKIPSMGSAAANVVDNSAGIAIGGPMGGMINYATQAGRKITGGN
jgi:hypothetical protein